MHRLVDTLLPCVHVARCRHLGEHDDGLDITGLLTDPCGAGSPGMGNSGLLFGEANAAPAGDAAIKMDE